MNREPILDSLEEFFKGLGYVAQSERGDSRLEMSRLGGLSMSARVPVEGFDYLYVKEGHETLLMIRITKSGPWVTPHECIGNGVEILRGLVENCEPFQQEWLKDYLSTIPT